MMEGKRKAGEKGKKGEEWGNKSKIN